MVYEVDPTLDERWDTFLDSHPQASIFHTRGWLQALRETYGYAPIAFTTSPPGQPLETGWPFCQISNWISGRRLVSLPFSDHCTPLVENAEQLTCLLTYWKSKLAHKRWNSIEIRPTPSVATCSEAFETDKVFFFHKLHLGPSSEEIWHRFHKNCVQRKVQRAAREGLTYKEGSSDSLVAEFYQLLLLTRRRHGLPAQPIQWFKNLVACLGDSIKIRVASKDGRPVASIVTLRYKQGLVYKYGCSNQNFNSLGGMQFLLWHAIQEAKNDHFSEFDMGRSDCENIGLIAFKDRWGAARTPITYLRYPARHTRSAMESRLAEICKHVWSRVPSPVLAVAGRMLYRYMG